MTRWWTVFAGAGWLALAGSGARGQSTDSAAKHVSLDPRDTLFLRARSMVLNGNGTAGRALVDSALVAAAGTPEYGIALYWRAALAATAADAERDYRRVIVEYPFSPHSGDALLALAQLEMARGDRDRAIDHLQRYLAQQPPNDPARVRAGIWLGRLLLEANELPKGCAVLLRTRAALGDTAVETRNQVDYYAARCVGVDTTSRAAASVPPISHPSASPPNTTAIPTARSSTATSRSRPTPVTRRDSGGAPNVDSPAGRFTVQVAAYDARVSADQLVAKLGERGIVARVVGKAPPFRVRIGHFTTEAAAMAVVSQLKEKGIQGFVTTTANEGASSERR